MMEMWMYDWKFRKLGRMKVAVAIGGSALVGAGASLFGSNEQANAATNASNAANQTQMNMYNTNQAESAPYRQAGTTALNTIGQDQANGTGFAAPFTQSSFMSDPGYQFQLQQGNQAVQRGAAAQGGLLSGAAGKAMSQYTTNLANTTYGDAYNRYLQTSNQQFGQLSSVANMGLNATNSSMANGQGTANQVANNQVSGITGSAAASAAGLTGATSALNSGLGNYLAYSNNQQNQANSQNLMQMYQQKYALNSAGSGTNGYYANEGY